MSDMKTYAVFDDVDDFDLVRHRYLHVHDLVHRHCADIFFVR